MSVDSASDRTSKCLRETMAYIVDELISQVDESFEGLIEIASYLWDRTRAIRNDFSITSASRTLEDKENALVCFQQIIRIHFLTLHFVGGHVKQEGDYWWSQDYEQMNNALTAVFEIYDQLKEELQNNHNPQVEARIRRLITSQDEFQGYSPKCCSP